MSSFVIICDGGHDKSGGYGSFLIIGLASNKRAQVIEHKDREPMGDITNNEAEYQALIESLKALHEESGHGHHLLVISDSQLMVRQLNGSYDAKNESLRALRDEALGLLEGFTYDLQWTPRTMIVSVLNH